MPDVFNRVSETYAGSFSADSALISFAGVGGYGGATNSFVNSSGLLLQSLSFGYQQQVTRIYRLGSKQQYYVAGRTAGQATTNSVFGPADFIPGFYRRYGDVCYAQYNHLVIALAAGCTSLTNQAGGVDIVGNVLGADITIGFEPIRAATLQLGYILLTNIGMSVQAQDSVISEALNMMFMTMKFPTQSSGSA